MSELTPLYDVKKKSRIDVEHLGMKYATTDEPVKELNFHHLDGGYSYCTDDKGGVIHLKASAEVKYLGKMEENE